MKENNDVRTKILNAATELFAEQGFAGTSIRQVGQRAGANPAMIHYYFDNKAMLLQAVVENVLEPMAKSIEQWRRTGGAEPGQFVGLLHGLFAKHPLLPRLMVREVLMPGGEMRDHFIEHLAPRLGGALPDLFAQEQRAGRLRANVDPRHMTLWVLAMSIFPFMVRDIAERVMDLPFDADGIERLTQQTQGLLQRGLNT